MQTHSNLKPGQRREVFSDYFSLGGAANVREQEAPTMQPATSQAPSNPAPAEPAAPVNPLQNVFDSFTNQMVDLLDDQDADPADTAAQIKTLLVQRSKAMAGLKAAIGGKSTKAKPAKKSGPPSNSEPPVHSVGPEDEDSGFEHFISGVRGLPASATGILENVRTTRQGEEYLSEDTRLAPATSAEFLAGLHIVRE